MTVPTRVRVLPATLAGSIAVPGDKSLSHRALILTALAAGGARVSGLAPSADVAATAAALRRLGATVDLESDGRALEGDVRGPLGEADDILDCGNSGTALRLLAGVAAGLDGLTVLTGDASLRQRPVDRVAVPLAAMGARIDARDGGHRPPLAIRGGALRGIEHVSPVASAQVKSCLLLAGLRADGETTVRSPLASRDHTERLVRHLGGVCTTVRGDDGAETVSIRPGALTARDITVAGDPSSAAFWLVAGAVQGPGVTATGVCANPTRLGVVDVLRELGAAVEVAAAPARAGEPVADVSVAAAPLGEAAIGGRTVVDALDELPVLAVAGACARGGLVVADAAELRVKETDRIGAMAAVFAALGMDLVERADGFSVPGGQRPGPGSVHARGDHRIAMAAAIAGTLGTGPVDIDGFDCVATSYPGFLDDLAALGGSFEVLAAAEGPQLHPAVGG